MRKILLTGLCIIFATALSLGQVELRERTVAMNMHPPAVNNVFPGTGEMIAGNLWDSFMPISTGVYYSEIANNPNRLWDLVRMGNFDRQWSAPTAMWPGGFPFSYYWNQDLQAVEHSPNINPTKQLSSSENFATMIWTARIDSLWQATFGMKSYVIGPMWVNPDGTPDPNGTNRYELYYEAGFPTNLGVWVTFRAIQYTQPWNSMNNFILIGVTFKNYGLLDVKADGHPTSTTNKIQALAMGWHSGDIGSLNVSTAGARGASSWGYARMSGYIADNDPNGSPWSTQVTYPGVNPANYSSYPGPNSNVSAGKHDMGINCSVFNYYTDVWMGKTWLGAKKDTSGLYSSPSAKTIFGSDPVGTGAERGWYMSSETGAGGLENELDAAAMYTIFTAEWYADGGKSGDASKLNLAPNPNYFQSGTAGDVLSFVPKASPAMPDGDLKSQTGTLNNVWESGWTKGYTATTNFDGDSFVGIGPFELNVGEAVTVVGAEYAGFRMQGFLNSLNAARYAWENGGVPVGPAAPDMKTAITVPDNKISVEWTKVPDESDPGFGGYKIYRASAFPQFSSLDIGFRTMQRYTEQMHAGSIDAAYTDAVNSNFDASGELNKMQAGYWGPWQIQAVIPKDSLQNFLHSDGTFSYAFKDNSLDVLLGFSYWYYVAAYNNETKTINGVTTNHLESGRVNENGALSQWQGTFPWATQSSYYPTSAGGQKAIGGTIVVQSPPISTQSLANGTAKIGVKPNPYKKEAFFDVGLEHKIMFYNLPTQCTITILDVSGQIIDQINYTAPTSANGTFFWDMYSKDGQEVANGLYIYAVQYDGGQQNGYFAILR
ncbi:MAG: hypothetical protein KGJ59_02200 [Bacteroidota bacterium]|nr:hypothetical protein [Bacteroidota bacterium]